MTCPRVAPILAQYCLRTRSKPGPMLSSPKALSKACPTLFQAWTACVYVPEDINRPKFNSNLGTNTI